MLFLYGLRLAPASDGAIIVPGLAPVFTAVLAWPLLGEHLDRMGAAGLGVAVLGLVLVVGCRGGHAATRMVGDVLFLLGAGCWAIYSLIGKAATNRFSAVRATLYGTITGTLVLLPFAIAEREWTTLAAAPLPSWIGTLYLAVLGTVVPFVFYYEGVRRIGAGRASSFALLVPICGVLSSVLVLGEQVSASTAIGGAFMLAGLWLVQRKPATAGAQHENTGLIRRR